MECKEQEKTFSTVLFDLLLEDLLVTHLAKYLRLQDIFALRCCSRYSKEVGDAMLADLRELFLSALRPRNESTIRVLFQNCRRLRVFLIILVDEKDLETYKWLSDEILVDVFSSNPLLENVLLDLFESLPKLTIKALIPLATSCKNLVTLGFTGTLNVDTFLKIINQHNNCLLNVNLSIENFSNEVIQDFFKEQPKLQIIRLPRLPNAGNCFKNTINAIAEFCKDLTILEFNSFTVENELALIKITDSCPKLKAIHFIQFSPTLSQKVTAYLRRKNILIKRNVGCEIN